LVRALPSSFVVGIVHDASSTPAAAGVAFANSVASAIPIARRR